MKKYLLIFLLSGCAMFGGGGGSIAESIDLGYLSVQSVASTVQAECASIVPDGECVDTSQISTNDKNLIKTQLTTVLDLLDSARLMLEQENTSGAAGSLQTANGVLSTIRKVLQNRGVQ